MELIVMLCTDCAFCRYRIRDLVSCSQFHKYFSYDRASYCSCFLNKNDLPGDLPGELSGE